MKNTNFTQQQIYDFLLAIDKDYPTPISDKVELFSYSEKLYEKAHVNTVIKNNKIVSLVAGYTENITNNIAFIALVGTLSDYRGKGYAQKLINEFIYDCRKLKINGIHLYAVKENTAAISMYEKIGFEAYIINDEPRPNDEHLVYWIKEKK